MILSTPPVLNDPHVVCDWLEIAVLADQYHTYAFDTLSRAWDTLRNQEGRDPEGGDTTQEAFEENVKAEVRARADLLGDCYPFTFSESGESLEFDPNACTDGGAIYLFCLLLSHCTQGAVFNGAYLPNITNAVRNYFQACATFAAAGEVTGHSYAFGFPRPDRTGFLEKLRQIYAHFGEGVRVRDEPLPGAPLAQKDAQIDVIAWEPKADGAAGKKYMLGQVASGANWDAKTIKGGPIDSFHSGWLDPVPGSMATAAMFVPFCYGNLVDGSSADVINFRSYEFGHIFYRFRIPVLAAKGLELARSGAGYVIERLDDLAHIRQWVTTQTAAMQAGGAHA
ncbi:hypothetical protein [Burkholderia cepacia]|uniref:hypothetical protein n=1 Tax=Burkholderia cepacia TaxID=292 RepID=UPI001CF454F0|nr:hypothetical protein [Burkholderia cepacia]MCA8078993.1 hypothetical protein [Burkholderia cepacia]